MRKLLTSLVIIAGFITGTAHAEFVSSDQYTLNDGRAMLDTTTGLEWLTVSQTRGLSFNNVNSLIANSPTYAGWRLPTESEVNAMFSQLVTGSAATLGLLDRNGTITPENHVEPAISQFRSILIDPFKISTFTLGFFYSNETTGQISRAGMINDNIIYDADGSAISLGGSNSNLGWFLVSEGGATLSSRTIPDFNVVATNGGGATDVPVGSLALIPLVLFGFSVRLRKNK